MPRRTWIKICGITRAEDAQAAAEAGVDALGFVLTPSPRRIPPARAREIAGLLPPHVLRVGVFVDEALDDVAAAVAAADVDRVQVHGAHGPALRERFESRLLRAFRARDENVVHAIREAGGGSFLLDAFSADAPGGTGRTFDWSLARRARALGRLILAGGLTPENVGRAVHEVEPFGVDVSSGVEESPGRKSAERIRAFVRAVREADRAREAAAAPPEEHR
jgi:phosphoribosylanthranilate isomerase